MAKKIKKARSWGFSSSEQSINNYVAQFKKYIDKEELSNAETILAKMERNFPSHKDVILCGLVLASELENLRVYHEKAEELMAKYPDEPQGYMALIDMYHEEEYHLLYLNVLEKFCNHFPNNPVTAEMQESFSEIKALFSELLEDEKLDNENPMGIAFLMEKSQFMLDVEKIKESSEILENVIILEPNFLPAYNNLSNILFVENKFSEAINVTKQVLEKDENNCSALENIINFFVILGERKLAEKYLMQIKTISNDDADIYLAKAHSMAWLADYESLVELGKEAELSEISEDLTAEFWHLIAVGYCNLGDEKKARQLWRKSLKLSPDFECAKNNLINLTLPVGEKINAWAFEFEDWISMTIVEYIKKTMKDPINEKNDVDEIFKEFPHLISLIPLLLKQGDSKIREIAVYFSAISNTEQLMIILKDFAFSQDGTDKQRIGVMQHIVNQGLVLSGKVKIWFKGKQKELLFMGIKLHDKPSIEHSQKVLKMGQEAIKFLHKKEGKKAELVLLEALKLEPKSPDLQYNLAGSYMIQKREKEGIELIKKIHQEYPDYPFARLGVAQFHLEDNELEEAEELLKPLFVKTEFNHNEFSKFCELHIKLAMAKKDLKEAHSWLLMWQRIGNEDDSQLEYWTDKLEEILSFI